MWSIPERQRETKDEVRIVKLACYSSEIQRDLSLKSEIETKVLEIS